MFKHVAAILFLVSLVTGCQTARNSAGKRLPADQLHLAEDPAATGKIIFLTYKVRYDSLAETYNFRLLQKQFANGQLSPDMLAEKPAPQQHYFNCEIAGAAGTQYVQVQDPLNQEVEYPGDPNNDAALTRTVIRAAEGEMTIRFQHQPGLKTLIIQSPNINQQLKTIYHAKL
jgi:hypothetical protein